MTRVPSSTWLLLCTTSGQMLSIQNEKKYGIWFQRLFVGRFDLREITEFLIVILSHPFKFTGMPRIFFFSGLEESQTVTMTIGVAL